MSLKLEGKDKEGPVAGWLAGWLVRFKLRVAMDPRLACCTEYGKTLVAAARNTNRQQQGDKTRSEMEQGDKT